MLFLSATGVSVLRSTSAVFHFILLTSDQTMYHNVTFQPGAALFFFPFFFFFFFFFVGWVGAWVVVVVVVFFSDKVRCFT